MTGKKLSNKEVFDFLDRISADLEVFIRNSIESSPMDGGWSELPRKFKILRCCEVKGCTKKECPAYDSRDYRCWLQAGTMRKGEIQGEFTKKYESCFKCDMFRIIREDPLRRLYEDIDILICYMQDVAHKHRSLARTDPLTGLFNRHFFNEIIEREMARAERGSETISFIMIDLDNFKRINDTHGHFAGDRLVVDAARLLGSTVRKSDLVFRFGGDEFLILMVKSGCEETSSMVERLLQSVDRWNNENAANDGCKLSFSIGCSTCRPGCDINAALNEADLRMYKDKRAKKEARASGIQGDGNGTEKTRG